MHKHVLWTLIYAKTRNFLHLKVVILCEHPGFVLSDMLQNKTLCSTSVCLCFHLTKLCVFFNITVRFYDFIGFENTNY